MELIELNSGKRVIQISSAESYISSLIIKHWSHLFPSLELIAKEFKLHGEVRVDGVGGRIDFFAYNPNSKSFVVIELKVKYDRNIRNQVFNYLDFLEDNFEFVYLKSKEIISLPPINSMNRSIEIVLISEKFKTDDFKRVNKLNNPITLIEYKYFENNYILIDSFSNSPRKQTNKELNSNQNIDNLEHFLNDFWKIFDNLRSNNILVDSTDYKFDGPDLVIRIDTVYNKYREYCLQNKISYKSLKEIRNQLKSSIFYIGNRSTRFHNATTNKQYVTVGYRFNLENLTKSELNNHHT